MAYNYKEIKRRQELSNYINDKVKIDFTVSDGLQEFIVLAEEADKNKNLGDYLAYIDEIDVLAKNCCACGSIAEHQ